MSLDGRITVDALFHHRDGTAAIKVVSLEDTTNYTTGKVAIVSGTVGTAVSALWSVNDGLHFGGYRDASGSVVTFASVSRVALRASGSSGTVVEDADLGVVELLSLSNRIAVADNVGNNLQIRTLSGTSSFTAVLYGT